MRRKDKNMSVRLARALASGRSEPHLRTRAEILAALLRKRSAAANAGLTELEAQIRNQILWALPMERPAGEGASLDPPAAGDGADADHAPGCGL